MSTLSREQLAEDNAGLITLLRQREEEIADLKSAVEVIQSSRDILLNTFTIWTVEYQQGKMALREVPDLRDRLRQREEELDLAERSLRNNGYRKTCDIAACNCGDQWHHGGHANERLREIDDALPYMNGKTILQRVEGVVEQLAASKARCKQVEEALKALLCNIDLVVYRDRANLRLGEAVPAYQHAQRLFTPTDRVIEELEKGKP